MSQQLDKARARGASAAAAQWVMALRVTSAKLLQYSIALCLLASESACYRLPSYAAVPSKTSMRTISQVCRHQHLPPDGKKLPDCNTNGGPHERVDGQVWVWCKLCEIAQDAPVYCDCAGAKCQQPNKLADKTDNGRSPVTHYFGANGRSPHKSNHVRP